MVLGETEEEFILRTQYGDAVIQKRDIANMKRYYGGVSEECGIHVNENNFLGEGI